MTSLASGVSLKRNHVIPCLRFSRQRRLALCLMLFLVLHLAATSVVAAAGCFNAPAQLVGWWPGDGNANDIVGTNTGMLLGGASANAAGVVGSAFSFDGTNGFVQIPDSPVFHPTTFTLEAWVLFTALNSQESGGSGPGNQYIIFKQNSRINSFAGFELAKTRISGGDVFYFAVDSASGQNASLESTTFLNAGVWYHVACVRGSNFIQFYLNGALQSQASVGFPQDYATLPLYFASTGQSYWNGMFEGLLDEVSLYSRDLSSNEIAAIYAAGSAGKCKAVSISAQPQSQTVPGGNDVTFTVTATGLAPLSYQWQFNGTNITGATGSSLTLTSVQLTDTGNYTVAVTNSLGAVTSAVATLTVLVPPFMTSQPGSQTVLAGAAVSFSAGANGTAPLSYQWQFNGTNLAGATSTNLLLNNVQPADAGNYALVVTNSSGSVTSTVATLTVLVPPFMTAQPNSQTVLAGATVGFSASAGGTTPLSYQWQLNGTNLDGATTTNLTLNNVQPTNAGNYVLVVTNAGGSVTSAVASLTVLVPPFITLQPASQTVLAGATAGFNVSAGGTTPLSYQWQLNGTNLVGATTTNLTLNNVQPTNAGSYVLVVNNAGGSVTSAVASLTVLVPPFIILQPASQTVLAGATLNFSASAGGTTPLSYQWQLNGTNLAGATTTNLTLNNVQPANAGSYAVVVTNAGGSVTSAVANLTVLVLPFITLQPASQTVLAGATVNFSAGAGGTTPLSYQWQLNGTNLGGATTTNLTLNNVQPANAGSYVLVVTNAGGSVTSAVASLTVLVPPFITLQPASQTVLAGATVGFNASAGGTTPLSYQWQLNGTNLGGATTTNLTLNGVQPSDGGNYTLVVTNLAGSITSSVAMLTVLVPPFFTLQPTSQTIVVGSPLSFSAAAGGTIPLIYQWQLNGTNLNGANSSNLTLNSVQPTDAGNYTLVVANLAGSVTSAVATLTVIGPPYLTLQPTNQMAAEGTAVVFSAAAGGTPPLTYQWRLNGTNLNGANSPTLALNNVQPTDAGGYSLFITNAAGVATSAVATLTVIVQPVITVQPSNQMVLAGAMVSFSAAAIGSAPLSYQWLFDGTNVAGAVGTTLLLSNAQPANSGNYALMVTNWAATVVSSNATLTVNVPPVIGIPPQSQTVVAGSNVTLSVSAFGLPAPVYQWQLNGAPLVNGGNVSGANTPTLSISGAQTNNAGAYTVVLTNAVGSVTSAPPALLAVLVPPSIITQPQDQTVAGQTSVAFTVSAAGTAPLSYQWLYNGAPLTNGLYAAGATASTLAINYVLPTHAGGYSVVVANAAGSVTSAAANLTVNAPACIAITDPNLKAAIYAALSQPLTNCLATAQLQAMTYLSACNLHISNLWGLEYAANLNGLFLSGNGISDLAPLAGMNRLVQLSLYHNRINNLWPLALISALTNLNAGDNFITDGSAIAGLTNLTGLALYGNSISDLRFLQGLSQIVSLALDRNAATLLDISPLARLTNLSSLCLGGNLFITNYAILATMTNLTGLSLHSGTLADLSVLRSLTRLAALDLYNNPVTDVSPLTKLANLRRLDLSWDFGISNSALLAACTSLTNLYLRGLSITNASFLANLARLQFLNLDSANVSDLSPLNRLTGLNYLVLSGNPAITNIGALSNLTNMINLELSRNSITNLDFLSNFTHLAYAELSYNAIKSISILSPLTRLTNLHALVLAGNPITNYTGLSGMAALSNLWLFNNSITNASFVTNVSRLSYLNLEGNQIADLSPLNGLTKLSGLGLSGNPVANYAFLGILTNLASLRLEGNTNLNGNLAFLTNLNQLTFLSLNKTWTTDLSSLANLAALNDLNLRRNRINSIQSLQSLPRLFNADLRLNFLDLSSGSQASAVITNLITQGVNVAFLPTNIPPSFASLPSAWFLACNATSSLPVTVSENPILSLPTSIAEAADGLIVTSLVVTASSSNPGLVSVLNNPLPGSNDVQTLSVTSLCATNLTSITLTVIDDVGATDTRVIQTPVVPSSSLASLCTNLDPNLAGDIAFLSGKPEASLATVDLLNLNSLSVSDAGVSDPCVWQWLTNLTALNLYGASISNLSFVGNLSRLTTIEFVGTAVVDVSPLAGLPTLTSLNLIDNPLTNYDIFLTEFSNLSSLSLVGNSISNLNFLTNLTQLTSLNLDRNLIFDLGPLGGLTNLTALFLQQNRLVDIQPLTSLFQLTNLDVSLNELKLTNPLVLEAIQTLQAQSTSVIDLPQAGPVVITARSNWIVAPGATNQTFFSVQDADPFDTSFAVATFSSNTNLIPNQSIAAAQYKPYFWHITVVPAANQTISDAIITLSVTNQWGFSANTTMTVSVMAPEQLDGQYLDDTNLTWLTSGNAGWFGETQVSHDGLSAAQSGTLGYDQESWLETSVNGPGILTFWWKASSPSGGNLVFSMNGSNAVVATGIFDWQQQTFNLPFGPWSLLWQFLTDLSTNSSDTFWLGDVNYTQLSWLQVSGSITNGQVQLLLYLVPGQLYEVQASTNLTDWSPLRPVVLGPEGTPSGTNGLPFVDTNAVTSSRFYRLHQLAAGSVWLDLPIRGTNGAIQLTLRAPAHLLYLVQASTNLADWTTLGVISNAVGTVRFTDSLANNWPARFYRAALVR